MSEWISVNDRLPECETEVFVLAVSSYGNKTVTTAMYEDGTMPEEDSNWNWEDVEMDYKEETDQYIIPEGWWEYRHYGESLNYGIDDKVTHWMPLPATDITDVKHGQWELKSEIHKMFDDVDEEFYVECPFCHRTEWVPFECEPEKMLEWAREKFPYCHCGAKMNAKEAEPPKEVECDA